MDNLIDQLKRDEGWVHTAYRDQLGFLTIGCGHNLDAKGLSDRAIQIILEDDIADAKSGLMGKWPWMRNLSPARLGAMINLAFNLGSGGLGTFKKFLKAAESGAWETAANELLDSKYAAQVGERARRIALQLKEDVWV